MAETPRNRDAIIQRRLAIEQERADKEEAIRARKWGPFSKGETGLGDRIVHKLIRDPYRKHSDRKAEEELLRQGADPVPVSSGVPSTEESDAARERLRRRLEPASAQNPNAPGMPPIENVAANDPNPNVRALGEQMARIENMLRGGVPGAPGGFPGMQGGMHPAWYMHPAWSMVPGGGGYGGGPMSAGALGQPGKASESTPASEMTREKIKQMIEEIQRENKETQPQAASGPEHQKAVATLNGKSKADYAKFVAERSGGDAKDIKRMMGAPTRWGWKFVSGMLTGTAAYLGKMLGAGVAGSSLGASLPAMLTGTKMVSLFGLATIPVYMPVALGAAVGVLGWQTIRWLTNIGAMDRLSDKGYEAKKVRNEMRKAEKRGYNPDIQKVYEKVHGRWKIFRMQTFLPGLLGVLAGGGLMHEAHTGFKNLNAENIGKAYETGKGGLNWLWERFSSFFTGGEPVRTGSTPVDHSAVIQRELDKWQWLGDREIAADELERAEDSAREARAFGYIMQDQVNRLTGDLATERPRGDRLAEAVTANRPRITPEPLTAPVPAPAPDPSAITVAPDSLAELAKKANFDFVINENTDVKNIPHALRGLMDSVGYKGRGAEWLIDTLDKKTYTGYGFNSGSSLLRDLTGQASLTPTTIGDGTPVHLKSLFQNVGLEQNLEGNIANSKVLTFAEKIDVRRWVHILQSLARR